MSKVLLYELNEVPWEIVDLYLERRPGSELGRMLPLSRCETTRNDDPDHLSPWRTWPTFHTGLFSAEHNRLELGQDPETFRGIDLWEVAEAEGLSVGLFGVLQSWPPRPFAHGGFYVPDTFARTPDTVPSSLERFQRFNLSMTNELGFSADAPLNPKQVLGAGFDLLRRGLSPSSAARIVRHLARERRDPRHKAGRSILQALPAFDLFWRLHRRSAPDLSVFFTNHVAGMMHRFWGDAVPGYTDQFGYEVDEVFAGFVFEAMDVFDRHLRRLVRFVDHHPDTVLVIASSMGQAAWPYHHIAESYVVDDAQQLAAALELGPVETGLAMYPMNSLELPTEAAARHAGEVLPFVVVGGTPLIIDVKVEGKSVTYQTRLEFDGSDLDHEVRYRLSADGPEQVSTIEALGLAAAKRLGGGNTAYHVPDGTFISYGAGISPDASRALFDVRDAAGRILEHLGVGAAWPAAIGRT